MDKRGQRKAIKHAQPCVIGDANRWMLQKEFHHLYPFVAATIFAMPNKTGAAARSTSQSHMARNRSAAGLSWPETTCLNQSHVLPSVYLRGLETENPACGQQSGVFAFEGRGFIPFYRAALVGKAGWVPQAQAYGPRAARLRSRPTSDDRAESPPNRGPGESSHRGRVSGGNGALGFSFPS